MLIVGHPHHIDLNLLVDVHIDYCSTGVLILSEFLYVYELKRTI